VPSPRSDPHGWNSWDAYIAAHDGTLGDYADHFLMEDRIERTLTRTAANWVGELVCVDGYEIHVRRLQIVDIRPQGPWVKTSLYSYHALRRHEQTTVDLFRYDNIHAHAGHPSKHHRHRFDRNGREILPVEHVGEDGWPNLGQVTAELYVYWQERLG
jgi:hypothetical protein